MYSADSFPCDGAKPLARSCWRLGVLPQSSLVAMTDWAEERTSCSVGSESEPATPKLASEGPMARTTTVLGDEPLITKPPIITLKPVCTWRRGEKLASRGGVGGGGGHRGNAASHPVDVPAKHAPLGGFNLASGGV